MHHCTCCSKHIWRAYMESIKWCDMYVYFNVSCNILRHCVHLVMQMRFSTNYLVTVRLTQTLSPLAQTQARPGRRLGTARTPRLLWLMWTVTNPTSREPGETTRQENRKRYQNRRNGKRRSRHHQGQMAKKPQRRDQGIRRQINVKGRLLRKRRGQEACVAWTR